ncbi:MAG: malonyl-CoA synthase [Alphaproteobacteria bacterium]|nr:malonyl-CoA synthase [Alphaproteobacteria bacterium]
MSDMFSAIRARMPASDTVFLTTPEGRRMSYGDVLLESARMAGALVASGVGPGDRVALQVDKSPEATLVYLACLRAGAVFLPLNTAYTLTELDYFLGDAEPALVICRPAIAAEVAALAIKRGVKFCLTLGAKGEGSLMDLVARQSESFADVPRRGDDLAAFLYTSGTTGRSKAAMLTHDNLASNAQVLTEYWRFTGKDVLLHALPIFHTHGLFVATNVVLFAGASMIFLAKFDADQVLALLPKATALMGVPTFYTRLLDHPGLTQAATAHMRLFVSGSAPLLAETHRAFAQRTGHAILERYGMTETGMIASNPYDGERIPGTVGFPLPGIEVRIADPDSGRALGTDEVGVIELRGPNVFKGYWRMPEKTKAEFRPDGFFVTGDVAKRDARGYIHIIGRAKDLVISGGYNVYPIEIEGEIDALPGIVESAVIGLAHPDFGEGVTAVAIRAKDAAIDEAQVLKALDGRLAKYKQPKRVLFVDELPRNAMGKVQKNLLRERFKDLYAKPGG